MSSLEIEKIFQDIENNITIMEKIYTACDNYNKSIIYHIVANMYYDQAYHKGEESIEFFRNIKKSETFYQKALSLAETTENTLLICNLSHEIAKIYHSYANKHALKRDYYIDKSLDLYERSAAARIKISGENYILGKTYHNMSYLFCQRKEFKKAKEYINKSIELKEKKKTPNITYSIILSYERKLDIHICELIDKDTIYPEDINKCFDLLMKFKSISNDYNAQLLKNGSSNEEIDSIIERKNEKILQSINKLEQKLLCIRVKGTNWCHKEKAKNMLMGIREMLLNLDLLKRETNKMTFEETKEYIMKNLLKTVENITNLDNYLKLKKVTFEKEEDKLYQLVKQMEVLYREDSYNNNVN